MKISWKLFKITYPYYCVACGSLHWEKRITCETCGRSYPMLKTTKKVYKRYKRNK